MFIAALRDLQWRRRRFFIAVVGTALVFATTLVLTGLSHGFDVEATDTVDALPADAWVVRAGAAGPFLGAAPILAGDVDKIAASPGVEDAAPFVYSRKSVSDAGKEDVNLFGFVPGKPGAPVADDGRMPNASGEIAVSSTFGKGIGETIVISGRSFRVVGKMHDSTAVAGVGNVFMVLDDAQQVAFSGQDIATAIATKGVPQSLPGGYTAVDPGEARADLLRPVNSARGGITFVAILLWLVAATIIGSIIYMSVLERLRDFAVFKAVGVTTRAILGGLAAQAAVFALAAAAIGTVVGMLLAPAFPLRAEIPFAAFIWLPVLAVGVGVLASAIGMRRVVSVDPALAFGGP